MPHRRNAPSFSTSIGVACRPVCATPATDAVKLSAAAAPMIHSVLIRFVMSRGKAATVIPIVRGLALLAVQRLLGHSSIVASQRYAHLVPQMTRDAVLLLDPEPPHPPHPPRWMQLRRTSADSRTGRGVARPVLPKNVKKGHSALRNATRSSASRGVNTKPSDAS
jgi:hypothetical protein